MSATLRSTEEPVASPTPIHEVGRIVVQAIESLGDLFLFGSTLFLSFFVRLPRGRVLWPILYEIGVRSAPVVCITGLFIGMVLAVQTYDSLHQMHFESQIGAVVNGTLVKELGPVLAAVMLAGRIGSAIAAQIGTMKISEQIDALRALGADPIAYLVVPRLVACCLMIPALTMMAEGMGILGGWLVSTQFYGVSNHFFWSYSNRFVSAFDVMTGIIKSICFGSAIAIIACHRGFRCRAGAEGVGQAATEAFVSSFVAILFIDFLLAIVIIQALRVMGMLGIPVI